MNRMHFTQQSLRSHMDLVMHFTQQSLRSHMDLVMHFTQQSLRSHMDLVMHFTQQLALSHGPRHALHWETGRLKSERPHAFTCRFTLPEGCHHVSKINNPIATSKKRGYILGRWPSGQRPQVSKQLPAAWLHLDRACIHNEIPKAT